eukprot:1580760-Rhodomonas_salina.1
MGIVIDAEGVICSSGSHDRIEGAGRLGHQTLGWGAADTPRNSIHPETNCKKPHSCYKLY